MAKQEKNVGDLELAEKPENGSNGHADGHADGHTESGLALRSEPQSSVATIGHLEIVGTILNNRPIEASHIRVLEHSLPGHRPIFASDIIVRDDLTLPGGRPIIASDSRLLEASHIIGGRPIASNDLGENANLMGFLD
jgi:hypothetical protein